MRASSTEKQPKTEEHKQTNRNPEKHREYTFSDKHMRSTDKHKISIERQRNTKKSVVGGGWC